MLIHTLPSGDEIHRYNYTIAIPFKGKRKVLSTSPLNGGYREDLMAVFNYDGHPGVGVSSKMRAPTYEEHMILTLEEIGLDPRTTAGMMTAANMDNVSIQTETFQNTTVTAIVTGGIEVNGGRIGDPADWHEQAGKSIPAKDGTINIFLVVSANLSEGCMTRAVVTCTEAKSAAIQELQAGSNYSRGLATGSGTDSTIIVSNAESDVMLTNAGKHSKLGELIGKAVKRAVKEALRLQNKLSPESQHNALRRLKRFGVDESQIYKKYSEMKLSGALNRQWFAHHLEVYSRRGTTVALTACFTQLMDEMDWGLLSVAEACEAIQMVAGTLQKADGYTCEWRAAPDEIESAAQILVNNWMELLAQGAAAEAARYGT